MIVPHCTRCLLKAVPLVLAVALLPASQAQVPPGSAGTAALQACPAVEDEILDLHILADGLKESRAVGLLEKLRLKSAIDDLLERFEAFHAGGREFALAQLQEQYDVLLMRIAAHLQHKDVILHQRLCNAWYQIWQDLEDPQRFAEKFS
jgi:hypothetical protein